MYTVSAWSVFKKTSLLAAVGNERESFMGICILGVMAASFVSSFFTSVLDGEWFMWIIGAGLCFSDAPLRNGDPTLQSSIPFDGQLEENGSSVEEERLQAYGTRK
jgi:hypothetical protein